MAPRGVEELEEADGEGEGEEVELGEEVDGGVLVADGRVAVTWKDEPLAATCSSHFPSILVSMYAHGGTSVPLGILFGNPPRVISPVVQFVAHTLQ